MNEQSQADGRGSRAMTTAILSAFLMVLVGCAQVDGTSGPASNTATPSLDWTTSIDDDTIRVSLVDSRGAYRVDKVTLVGPGGQSIDAFELTRVSHGGNSAGPGVSTGVGVGVGVGSSGTRSSVGIGVGIPLGSSGGSGNRRVNQTEALIRVPNPEVYRRTAEDWMIRVALIDTRGGKLSAAFPAPIPSNG